MEVVCWSFQQHLILLNAFWIWLRHNLRLAAHNKFSNVIYLPQNKVFPSLDSKASGCQVMSSWPPPGETLSLSVAPPSGQTPQLIFLTAKFWLYSFVLYWTFTRLYLNKSFHFMIWTISVYFCCKKMCYLPTLNDETLWNISNEYYQ